MAVLSRVSKCPDGYVPRGPQPKEKCDRSKRKGMKQIDWETGDKALIKIVIQTMMERNPHSYATRVFGGNGQVSLLLDHIEKHYPAVYEELQFSRCPQYAPRNRREMIGVLYDRGQKGFYVNDGKFEVGPDGRAKRSKEHYSNSPKLYARRDEAIEKFGMFFGQQKGKT